MKKGFKNYYLLLVITILALFNVILHLVVSYNLEYHRDELLYFSLGMHPGFGYATVPPLIGWIAWLMQNIFGYTLFAVRIFPALLGGIMVFLISAIAKELGESAYSRILAAIGIIISGFGLRTFLLYQPVHIDLIYINDELGEDVKDLFRKITNVGSNANPDAREYGTTVYLCEDPVMSFNDFWNERISEFRQDN